MSPNRKGRKDPYSEYTDLIVQTISKQSTVAQIEPSRNSIAYSATTLDYSIGPSRCSNLKCVCAHAHTHTISKVFLRCFGKLGNFRALHYILFCFPIFLQLFLELSTHNCHQGRCDPFLERHMLEIGQNKVPLRSFMYHLRKS